LGAWWWKIGAAGLVATVLTALVLLLAPQAPHGLENGNFENDCCGSLRLHDGEMILNGKVATSYTVGRDASGPYVRPLSYVGSLKDIGFEIDGARPASKLRLDRMPNPTNLLVQGGRETYIFKRQPVAFP
jgi:hypothetical protein